MQAFIVFSAIFAVAFAQQGRYVDPKNAAILAEARYLSGDGSFGAAYVQEDGVEFKEETALNGERKGQYSYVDPNGKKITVQYTAGKNGFQVSGDHLPKAPAPLPQQAPAPRQQYQPAPQQYQQPAPQYNSQPQYNAIPQQQQNYNTNTGDDGSYDANKYEIPYQNSYNANANVNSNIQSASLTHQQQLQAHQEQLQHIAQVEAQQQGQHQQPQYQQYNNNPQYAQQYTTTPAPNRFFPPGKLNLNRTPDGYQYNFSSQ